MYLSSKLHVQRNETKKIGSSDRDETYNTPLTGQNDGSQDKMTPFALK